MRRGGLALIAILVLGSLSKLMIPQSSPSPAGPESRSAGIPVKVPAEKQVTPQALAKESSEWYPTQVREKIRDFFGEEYEPEIGAAKEESLCLSVKNWCVPGDFQARVHFVIATSPDPVHSHLGLFFDRSIDAIEQGATSKGYLIDRAIMPWLYFEAPASQETEEDKLLRRERESFPGLMIFRSEKNDPLFVFVVGETPTAGINKEQFHHAVKMIHEIREGKDAINPEEMLDFAVLGPNFSGSLYSLQKIFHQYLKDYPDVPGEKNRVLPVYADVMGAQAIQDFSHDAPSQVRMAIFVEDGQTELLALVDYLKGLHYDDADIAVLNEDDTSYGTSGTSSTASAQPQSPLRVLNLSFPRGISQFRSAYSKDLQNQDQTADPNQPQRRNLRLDLEVTGSDDDNVAPYAATQTALSQEAIMLAIVSELRQRSAKFVLIRATDPLDELFLSRYLNTEYSQARLVVPTPDLLFARDEGGLLDGALGLNSYPLSPAYLNPVCSQPAGAGPQIYPASSSAGLYNATFALLSGIQPSGAAVSPVPISSKPVVESLSPAMNPCQLSPNLWLTIVSRNMIYPLKVLFRPEGSLFFPKSGAARRDENDRRSSRIPAPWILSCALCLALVGLHLRQSWTGGSLGQWRTVRQEKTPGKAWILLGGAVALAGMLVVIASSVAPLTSIRMDLKTVLFNLVWGILLLFALTIGYDFLVNRKEPNLACIFVGISACLAAAGIAYAYWSSRDLVLWQQRALDLASHVSPTTPLLLLLAAYYGWFWYSLKSESLTDWRCPQLPSGRGLPETYDRLTESRAECIRKVIHPFTAPWWVLGASAGIVVCLALPGLAIGPGHVPLRSLEGLIFDGTYSFLFGIALVLLIATLLRIIAVWREFRLMLTALDRPGLRQALQQLKGFEWDVIWNPIWSMQNEARRLVSKEVQVADRLLQSLGSTRKMTNPRIFQLRKQLRKILVLRHQLLQSAPAKCPTRFPRVEDLMGPFEQIQKKLALTAGILCKDFLEPSWKMLPADNGADAPHSDAQDSQGTTIKKIATIENNDPSGLSSKSLQLAEEFVACIYANFITTVLLRIRWLVFSSVVIYTAVVFSSISYPFQPAPSLSALALLLFLLGAIVVGYVYEEMHRDPTVRCMTSTDPNKIDAAFWFKLVSAGLLPLLGLLTSLFPQVGHFLYTIAAPILQATR
jgi:hypothetical protein